MVKLVGDPVPAEAVQNLLARMCPSSPLWTWEAIPQGSDAFLIGLPSLEDLARVDGLQLGIPAHNAQATISVWKSEDIAPTRVLEQVWVHVQGVPFTVRHFLGIWAVGSLIGTTLDVDLVTLKSRGIVRILVGMLDSKTPEKRMDASGPYIAAACVVRLREFIFTFRHEPADFVPDPSFVPFFWRRKGDDVDGEDEMMDKGPDGSFGSSGLHGAQASNMDVDASIASV